MYSNSPQSFGNRRTIEYDAASSQQFQPPISPQQTFSIPLLPQSAGSSSSLQGRPYTKKAPSKVWMAYTKSEHGPVCNYCGSIRKRKDSSTKTLWDHLDRKHYEVAMVLRRESRYHMPSPCHSMESSISSLVPHAFSGSGGFYSPETHLNDMPSLYSSLFAETSKNKEGLIKTESSHEQRLTPHTGNRFKAFTPPITLKEDEESKCCITEMSETGKEGTISVSAVPSLPKAKDNDQDRVSLVRWSLMLTALPNSSALFGITVHGIRIDTGMDFASAQVIQVTESRSLTTTRETVTLVGPINAESIAKNKAKLFEAGLPADWRNIIIQQYMDGIKF